MKLWEDQEKRQCSDSHMKVANIKSWLKCSANNWRDCFKGFDFASIEDGHDEKMLWLGLWAPPRGVHLFVRLRECAEWGQDGHDWGKVPPWESIDVWWVSAEPKCHPHPQLWQHWIDWGHDWSEVPPWKSIVVWWVSAELRCQPHPQLWQYWIVVFTMRVSMAESKMGKQQK